MSATVKSRLPLIMRELTPKLTEGVLEVAEAIAEGARERVPVDSGALRDAIHVEQDGETISVTAGDTQAWYGHIVENGSVNQPARPFLIPAYEAERPKLSSIIGEKLRDL